MSKAFEALIESLFDQLEAVENYISFISKIENAIQSSSPLGRLISEEGFNPPVNKEDKIFRHRTVVTQLYSSFEGFCRTMLREWLAITCAHKPFSELPEQFQKRYIKQSAKLIQDLDMRKNRHLNAKDVITRLHESVQNNPRWQLLPEALLSSNANLRLDELANMCAGVDLKGLIESVDSYFERSGYDVHEKFDKAARDVLSDLVNYRNDAAHGAAVDEILSLGEQKEFINFTFELSVAFYQFVMSETLDLYSEKCVEGFRGIITSKVSTKGNIYIVNLTLGSISLGDKVVCVLKGRVSSNRIRSIMVNDEKTNSISVSGRPIEVGIQLENEARENAALFASESWIWC